MAKLNLYLHRDEPWWLEAYNENLRKVKRHVAFCCKIYQRQIDKGKSFLHEHPLSARSWQLECVKIIEKQQGVQRVRLDKCQYVMVSQIDAKDGPLGPVSKPTGMLTNAVVVFQ